LSFNAYRAAVDAGYTENTAAKGSLLHVPKIQAYLKAAMNRSAARAELTHDMLLRELMKIAFCNMGNYYDDYGLPKKMHQLTDEEKAAVSYYQRADMCHEDGYIYGELVKIKLHNKMQALDKLCKHTGFYKAKWEPLPEVDRSDTPEDIAFEAEDSKVPHVSGYTEEVCEEIMADLRPQIEAAGWYMGETGDGGQKSEDGSQTSEDGSQTSEDGSQKSEDGSQTSEDGGRMVEVEGDVLRGKLGVDGRHDGVLNPLAPDSYRDGQHDRDIIAGTKTVERDLMWDEDEVMDENEAWPN